MSDLRNPILISLVTCLFLFVSNTTFTQEFPRYLIQDKAPEIEDEADKKKLDSCIQVYWSARSDSARFMAIQAYTSWSYNPEVWSKYNLWVKNQLLKNGYSNAWPKWKRQVLLDCYRYELVHYLYDLEDVRSTDSIYTEALSIANQMSDQTLCARLYRFWGTFNENNGKYDEAVEGYRRALRVVDKNDHLFISETTMFLGQCHQTFGNYYKAIDLLNESLAFSKKNKVQGNLGSIYLTLGNIFGDLENSIQSEKYYRLGLENNQGQSVPDGYFFNNIAQIKLADGKLKDAFDLFEKAYQSNKASNNDITTPLQNMGDIYVRQGQFDLAEQKLNAAKESFDFRIGDLTQMISIYVSFFELYWLRTGLKRLGWQPRKPIKFLKNHLFQEGSWTQQD